MSEEIEKHEGDDKSALLLVDMTKILHEAGETLNSGVSSSEKIESEISKIATEILKVLDQTNISAEEKIILLRDKMKFFIGGLLQINSIFKDEMNGLKTKNDGLKKEISVIKQVAYTDKTTKLYNKNKLPELFDIVLRRYNSNEKFVNNLTFGFYSISNIESLVEQFGVEVENDIYAYVSAFLTQQFKTKGIICRLEKNKFIIMSGYNQKGTTDFLSAINKLLSRGLLLDVKSPVGNYTSDDLDRINTSFEMLKSLYDIKLSIHGGVLKFEGQNVDDILEQGNEVIYKAESEGKIILKN